ncbi:hypothetical protein DIPPA_12460 [Diplonema papillatum]|nr:hypothetical protein DIPPA_12460 [Diplonema papillatum]
MGKDDFDDDDDPLAGDDNDGQADVANEVVEDDGELRVDDDGQPYTKTDFLAFYGGLDEWNARPVYNPPAKGRGRGSPSPSPAPSVFSFASPFSSAGPSPKPGAAASLFAFPTATPPAKPDLSAFFTPPPGDATPPPAAAQDVVPPPQAQSPAEVASPAADRWVCVTCGTPKSLNGAHLAGKSEVSSQCNSRKCGFKKRMFTRNAAAAPAAGAAAHATPPVETSVPAPKSPTHAAPGAAPAASAPKSPTHAAPDAAPAADRWVCATCGTPKSLTGAHLAGKSEVSSQCNSRKCGFKKRMFARQPAT